MSVDKFRKALNKKEFNVGFSPVPDWISTGNSALNHVISGSMKRGIPIGRSSIISGLQGSGKSFLLGNIAANAQKKGYYVLYLDSEYSLGEGFLEKIGVDMSEDKLMPVNIKTLEEMMAVFSEFFKSFGKEEKVLIILDSLSNLELDGDFEKNSGGNIAYGQGLKQKVTKQGLNAVNARIGDRNVAFVTSSHLFVNGSDAYGNPILKPNIGEAAQYIPSVGVQLTKGVLKEGKETAGIRIKATTFKTRFTKLGRKCEINLPWDTGMDFYDGASDVLVESGILEQNAAWLSYVDENGEEIKFQKKDFHNHMEYLMDLYDLRLGGKEPVESEDGFPNEEDTRETQDE